MALNDRKIAHIRANRTRIRQGRLTPVALVSRQLDGTLSALRAEIVLKQEPLTEPTTEDQSGLAVAEYRAEFPLELDPRLLAYVALTPDGATDDASLAAATLLEVLHARPAGIVANRWQVALRRLQ
jgi:hypothetical protein